MCVCVPSAYTQEIERRPTKGVFDDDRSSFRNGLLFIFQVFRTKRGKETPQKETETLDQVFFLWPSTRQPHKRQVLTQVTDSSLTWTTHAHNFHFSPPLARIRPAEHRHKREAANKVENMRKECCVFSSYQIDDNGDSRWTRIRHFSSFQFHKVPPLEK